MLFAPSMGPFKKNQYLSIIPNIVNKIDLITLREPTSKTSLEDLPDIKTKSIVTSDLSFLQKFAPKNSLTQILEENNLKNKSGKIMGITVKPAVEKIPHYENYKQNIWVEEKTRNNLKKI